MLTQIANLIRTFLCLHLRAHLLALLRAGNIMPVYENLNRTESATYYIYQVSLARRYRP